MPGPCPETERLSAALRRGEAGDEADLVAHLSHCSSCQTKLEVLAGGSGWIKAKAGARGFGVRTTSQALREAMQCLETRSGMLENDTELPPRLDFLEPSDKPGTIGRFGPYEVLAPIASGGMGIVLKAHDPALDRVVALKILSPALASNALARARFVREGRAAAAVVHEHVVPIYAVAEFAGLPYLVMQFIEGRSLAERIRLCGPLRLEEILRIGAQTAGGLAAAHAQGIVHRDVKPGNILLENSVERVKLTDFGLARAADDAGLTRTGELAGTPEFMSPEQAGNEPIDHRSDLFSFGSVLYAMCTGASPFQATSVVAAVRKVCDARPQPVYELNPAVPRWLSDIVGRLMAKAPGERYQSAREVGELLERYLARVQHGELGELPSLAKQTAASRRLTWRVVAGSTTALALTGLMLVALQKRRSVPNASTVTPVAGPMVNPANGHVYYLLSQDTWTGSEQAAKRLGGHLVTINDQAEQDWVFSTFGNYGGTPRCLWIGFRRSVPHGAFQWVGDTNSTYSNWAYNEPSDDTNGILPETFVHMWDGTRLEAVRAPGKWNDLGDLSTLFGKPLHGVMEIDLSDAGSQKPNVASPPVEELFTAYDERNVRLGGFVNVEEALQRMPAGGVVELRWNGSREMRPVTLPAKPLTLRAARDFQPTWTSSDASTPAITASAGLTLRDIRFVLRPATDNPGAEWPQFRPRAPRASPSGLALVSMTNGALCVTRCILDLGTVNVADRASLSLANVTDCRIEDTLLFAPPAKAVVWQQHGNRTGHLTLSNCIAVGGQVFWLDFAETARTRLDIVRCTLYGAEALCIAPSMITADLELEARASLFDTGFIIFDGRNPPSPPLPQWLRWDGRDNLYSPDQRYEQRYVAGITMENGPVDLNEWNLWWNQPDSNARQVQVAYSGASMDRNVRRLRRVSGEPRNFHIMGLERVDGPPLERQHWEHFGADTGNVGPGWAK